MNETPVAERLHQQIHLLALFVKASWGFGYSGCLILFYLPAYPARDDKYFTYIISYIMCDHS